MTLPVISYQQTYGQNVTIQCSVTATPAITSVLWQRLVNGNYVDITTQSSTKYYGGTLTNYALTITNLVFTHNGEYRCTATNQVGRGVSANRASLQVLGSKYSSRELVVGQHFMLRNPSETDSLLYKVAIDSLSSISNFLSIMLIINI